jgi:cullin 3
LLDLRDKYNAICAKSFRGDKKAQKRLKEAFEDFINTDARCASFLAQYVDDLLRSGLRLVVELCGLSL